jgi:hypothetical protein
MSKYIHDPLHRSRMRELIQGFIEHCEVSQTLVGRIERLIEFDGRKYGVPAFTVFGPARAELETQFVGLVGVNDGQDARAAETLLQLIERVAVQPRIAEGSVLQILPVTDPVGLELDAAVPSIPEDPYKFRREPVDGLIELEVSGAEAFSVAAEGPTPFLQAVASAEEVLHRLAAEEPGDRLVVRSQRIRREGAWRLSIRIPQTWPAAASVHWGSQFLVLFFRAHATRRELALREGD